MWRLLYNALLLVAWPWVLVRLRWRARREPAYGERIGERFGRVPASVPQGCVWIHTVSAGETIAAAPLIGDLTRRFPGRRFLVTTMTPTGSGQVQARLGGRVAHCYAPYDFPWAVRRFFERVAPPLLVLMETELWPNLIGEAARRGVPVLLVNARLSERSARGYARLGALTRRMLGQLHRVACQYAEHARRFEALGVPPGRLTVHGSVKFDARLPDDHESRVEALRRRWGLGSVPVWIAASTHEGEEPLVLAAHQRLRAALPGVRLILVPRHPARAGAVAELCRQAGLGYALQSSPGAEDARAEVLLGDCMGELLYLYGLADAAFVGGSLVDLGGHNPIEPALWGLPVVMGPGVFNFAEVVAAFRERDCLDQVGDAAELAACLQRWLEQPALRRELGARASQVVAANAGATERLRGLLETEITGLAVARAAAAPD